MDLLKNKTKQNKRPVPSGCHRHHNIIAQCIIHIFVAVGGFKKINYTASHENKTHTIIYSTAHLNNVDNLLSSVYAFTTHYTVLLMLILLRTQCTYAKLTLKQYFLHFCQCSSIFHARHVC